MKRRRRAAIVAVLASLVVLGACSSARSPEAVETVSRAAPSEAGAARSDKGAEDVDPTAEEGADAQECRRWEDAGKGEPEGESGRPPGDYQPGIRGLRASPGSYLDDDQRAKLRSVPLSVAPTWLPEELRGRKARVGVVGEPSEGQEKAGGWRIYSVEWPRETEDSAEVSIAVYVSERHPLRAADGVTEAAAPPSGHVRVRGKPAELMAGPADHDGVFWWWDDTYTVEVFSQTFDYRINCRELLSIARSVERFES